MSQGLLPNFYSAANESPSRFSLSVNDASYFILTVPPLSSLLFQMLYIKSSHSPRFWIETGGNIKICLILCLVCFLTSEREPRSTTVCRRFVHLPREHAFVHRSISPRRNYFSRDCAFIANTVLILNCHRL